MIRCFLLLCVLIISFPLAAESGTDIQNEVLSEDETERNYLNRRREKAANYRLARAKVYNQLSDEHHQRGWAYSQEIGSLLEQGAIDRARDLIKQSQQSHGYSDAAGALQHAALRIHLAVGDIRRARLALVDLVERYPDYKDIETAFAESLLITKRVQASGSLINLNAATPREAIIDENAQNIDRAQPMLRYLARNGDHHQIAPDAALHFARALLVRGHKYKDRILQARAAYEYILDTYPQSPAVFSSLCELALSHLIMYRGDKYDVGALINAAALIHRAKIYVGDSEQRESILRQYEDMILRWHQERDLQVARWYKERGKTNSARYYFTQAIAHNPSSPNGIAAQQELNKLPPANDN